MRLRAIALAAVPAALFGVMVSAPSASAWAPGNCGDGTFCVWPEFWYGDTDIPPSLATDGEWSGNALGHIYYNNTSRDAVMTYVLVQDGGQGPVYTACVSKRGGNYFTVPVSVTNVTWREDDGSPCW